MYNVCTYIYTVWPCICNVCTWHYTVYGLSVEETDDRKEAALQERSLRWAETCLRRKADLAWWEVKCCFEVVQTCLYYIHTYIYIHERVCTMYIQIYSFMNLYFLCTYFVYIHLHVHTHSFMNVFVCTWYKYVCFMFRRVCAIMPYPVQVVRIPDDRSCILQLWHHDKLYDIIEQQLGFSHAHWAASRNQAGRI
jgi:hypothetical protein